MSDFNLRKFKKRVMEFPSDLKYTEDHEWVRLEDNNVAVIGITDYAQNELGELVYVEIDTVGDVVDKGEVFGTVEAVKTTSELFMPCTGKVIEFNPALDENEGDNPALVNDEPYTGGWIVKIEVTDTSDLDDLMDVKAYQALIGK